MTTYPAFKTIKATFETLLTLKNAFNALKATNALTNEMGISELVEKFFAFEMLPKDRIKLDGTLSPYIPNTQVPVYSPLDFKNPNIERSGPITINEEGQKVQNHRFTSEIACLNVPSMVLNPIKLADGSSARVLWLYPPGTNGISFPIVKTVKLKPENIDTLFNIDIGVKPIPVLVDHDLQIEQYLYKNVTIFGDIITAQKEHFEISSQTITPFLLNFFSNCIRPFATQDGVLAIDIRKPKGKIEVNDSARNTFNITYTIQGMVSIPMELEQLQPDSVTLSKYVDMIPDRQGISPYIKAFKDGNANSLITMGEISWQYSQENKCFGAFIPMDAANPIDFQTKLTKLAFHWQGWQKFTSEKFAKDYNCKSHVDTIICSNKSHATYLDNNGLQISKSLKDNLLNQNPLIRSSIDWLGVSTGKGP